MAHLCSGGDQLRKEINALWPHRDKASDGWIGDAAHQARPSDHNPDARGVVHAIDVDKDLDPADKRASWRLAEQLRQLAIKDGRIKYIIHMGQITSASGGGNPLKRWKWRPWTGDPHNHHLHISFTTKADTNARPFGITK